MIVAETPDDHRALIELCAPLGVPGSGRLRYAAAMYFNRAGKMSDQALEVFRICSPIDHEDPAHLLHDLGLSAEIPSRPLVPAELAIRILVEEIGRYIASLSGPGIAETLEGLARFRDGPVTPQPTGRNNVVNTWMPTALGDLSRTHPNLATAISAAQPHLRWITFGGYPAEEVGSEFLASHAFASIFGEPPAAIRAVDWDMGLFLIAPHVLYRDHRHQAPELYVPLTGPHGWRFGADKPLVIKAAHDPVWNDPFVSHLTKVGPAPFLSLYVWTRDVNAGAEIVPATDWPALEALRLEARCDP